MQATLAALGMTLAALWSEVPALAQSTGTITGVISDSAKTGLGKAHVTITGAGTTLTPAVKPDGSFSADVPPGIYAVTASENGFQSSETDNVVVTAGASTSVAVTLLSSSLTTIGRVTYNSQTTVKNTPAAISTLTAANFLDQGQKTVVNTLDSVPGVEIFRVNGGSTEPYSNASISIRGAQPYESQVLIDGHPVNTGANGVDGVNVAFTDSFLLSGVEVSKGPGNMPNTIADAVGGTVNFKTADITQKPSANLVGGYDNYRSFYYGLTLSNTFGKLGVLVGAARNVGPGYLTPQNLYGADNYYYSYAPYSLPVTPNPYKVYGPGRTYTGVVNFSYPATSDYWSNAQLAKISWKFSPVTSVLFSEYSTQTWVDETGNNVGNVMANIVCVIPTTVSCTPPAAGYNANANYTATPFLGLVGQTVPINLYAAYPNTTEYYNQPIYSGEFRTVLGPGSFLARYYAGSVSRNIPQNPATYAISPCYSPSCAWLPYDPANPNDQDWNDNGYPGEPYYEETTDYLHGFDAQYTVPFGQDYVTLGYDRHVDQAIFQELFNNAYQGDTNLDDYYTLGYSSSSFVLFQNISYSLRAGILVAPHLTFNFGGYASSSSYVGSRFDPRAALTYKPNSSFSVRASWGSAFVQPYYNLVIPTEKVKSGSLLIPSTTFAPETSSSYDLGTDVKLDRNTLLSADYYFTTLYNRYAEIVVPVSGTYNGAKYSSQTINAAEGDGVNEGFELAVTSAPKYGLGYKVAVDLLRDYAYNQIAPKSSSPDLFYQQPANGIQLPGYPFSKFSADLSWKFANASVVDFGSQTFGANNEYGGAGFTVYNANYTLPMTKFFSLDFGATNIFNQGGGQTGGAFYGGFTYPTLSGGVGPTNLYYYQPATYYVQARVNIK